MVKYIEIGAASSISNHVITGLQDNGTKELFNNLWYESPPGGDGMECIVDPTNGNIQYAAVQNGKIFKTTDAWQNSTQIVDNDPQTTGINEKSAWVTPYLMHPIILIHLLLEKNKYIKLLMVV